MKSVKDFVRLSNGYNMPIVGFGTWQTNDGATAESVTRLAIEAGYRHIDTAACYGTEPGVGKAVRECGVAREELFVTSKVWNTERGYDKTMIAFDITMESLGLDYLDLYLIHWPANKRQFANWDEINLSTWRAMTELYKEGRIKAIGVSNFLPHHLESLMATEIKPMVNQIEFHPCVTQKAVVDYCKANNIVVQAWSPLGTGKVLSNPTLIHMAKKYNRSVAQLCIRWCLQNGTVPLPKSATPSRIIENTRVFDFEISAEDMAIINAMPDLSGTTLDPDNVDF